MYNVTNTNNATQNYATCAVVLSAGQTITLGTCPSVGGSGFQNTYLRLMDPAGNQVAYDNDGCSCSGCGIQEYYLSIITYSVPLGGDGTYTVREGCDQSSMCRGTVRYTIMEPPNVDAGGPSPCIAYPQFNSVCGGSTPNYYYCWSSGDTLPSAQCTSLNGSPRAFCCP